MKFRFFVLLGIALMLMSLFTGCAQPNDPEENNGDEVYLQLEAVYPSEGYVLDFQVTDDYVYAAEDEAGFSIWDNNSEALINRSRSINVVDGSDTTTIIFSNIKLVAVDTLCNVMLAYNKYGSGAGVIIIDIADKSNPQFEFRITGNNSNTTQLELTEIDSTQFKYRWLYDGLQNKEYYGSRVVYNSAYDLWTVNTQYAQTCTFDFDVVSYDEDTEAGLVYCASKQLGMKTVEKLSDTEDFAFPEISTIETRGQTIAVKVVDNIAYLGNREDGIQVMDISDISNPIELFNYDTTGLASDIAVDKELNIFALASTSGGIYLFQGPDGEIKRLQRIDDSEIGYTYKVKINGGYLYAGTRYGVYKYKIVNI